MRCWKRVLVVDLVRAEARSWGRNWERRVRSAGRMKTRRRAAAALKAQRGFRILGCWVGMVVERSWLGYRWGFVCMKAYM